MPRGRGANLVLRHGSMLGLGVALVAAPALGQAPAGKPANPGPTAAAPPARSVTIAQTATKPAQRLGPSAASPPGVPHTLAEALAATYSTQPALLAERAKLRATDENVPQALAGWRPTVVMAGTAGYGDGFARLYTGTSGRFINSQTDRLIGTAQATLTQPVYTGGKTQANVNRAKNQVIAEQLQATNDRFRVGEITRTDVAQAEAALAGATAQRETSEGNLQTARGTFQQVVGYYPPGDLVEPQPLALPVRTEQDATVIAGTNNPQVVAA